MNYKKDTIVYWVIGIITIVISLLLIQYFPKLPVISDSKDYHDIAINMMAGHAYLPISGDAILYPPLYPTFLAIIYSLSAGTTKAVYFFQYLLVGGMSILMFWITRNKLKLPFWIAVGASLSILLWPYFILYSQLISSEILYSFLLLLGFFFLIRTHAATPLKTVIFTGIIFGLAILTRPVALLLLPWLIIVLPIAIRTFRITPILPIPWKRYLQILLIAFITLLPWELYVKITYDRFIPVASNLSYVFKKANGSMAYLSADGVVDEKPSLLEAKAKNLYLFWNPGAGGYHLDIVAEKYPVARYGILLYKIGFFLILACACIGLLKIRKEWIVVLALAAIGYFWALHTILFPFPRYTLPIIPLVIILAAIGVQSIYLYLKQKHN